MGKTHTRTKYWGAKKYQTPPSKPQSQLQAYGMVVAWEKENRQNVVDLIGERLFAKFWADFFRISDGSWFTILSLVGELEKAIELVYSERTDNV